MPQENQNQTISRTLKNLGINDINEGTSTGKVWISSEGPELSSFSPVDGKLIAKIKGTSDGNYQRVVKSAKLAFKVWRATPAPKRGDIIRQVGDELRDKKEDLGRLVSYEMGKSLQEGWGEVQEMIDICDFALGLSRQLYGLTMHSERPGHRMYEQYHPLGIVGIISAFNFPVAVWSWNTMVALVCGDVCIWKPSEKTPLCAIACQKIISNVLSKNNAPEGVSNLVIGDADIGQLMANDNSIPLVSATGSTTMGKAVGEAVGRRLGRSILELGGNNAIIISKDADLEMTLRAVVFGAVGTAGQRCTTTRRLIIHHDVYEGVKLKLTNIYKQLKIGDPLDQNIHVGPLIDQESVNNYLNAIEKIKAEGGKAIVKGGLKDGEGYESGCYVKPAVFEVKEDSIMAKQETFAPILYLIKYKNIEDAIAIHNNVPQGLSSAIMTNNMRESELFLSHAGSDCGIANVNIGTSGAEIGGAFGGEKDTGGGRESGSDAWKTYMRRQTNTINYSINLPLAQGIKFDF
ncbi:MAG TPA: aldehyde dehydrogenase family protein [Cyclobacteriaceae bacterium]